MQSPAGAVERQAALTFLDDAVPEVYGYLLHRTRHEATAQDLTSETMLAAVRTLGERWPDHLSVAWLIGIARHKLVDHWRHLERERRVLELIAANRPVTPLHETFDLGRAEEALSHLRPMQRTALTLRYVDGLSVSEVATLMERSFHATEKLLVRSRAAFRSRYGELEQNDV